MTDSLVVIGAGVAGLACARGLVEAGHAPIVLDKARGVGGRCATRRVEGQPVDHGVSFLHGTEPRFVEALRRLDPQERIDGWPSVVEGSGDPCHPEALVGPTRLALRSGVSAFPKALAREVDVRLQTRVTALQQTSGGLRVTAGDEVFEARTVVLTAPLEQTRALLAPLAEAAPSLRGVLAMLRMTATVPCLSLIAAYPRESLPLAFDVRLGDRGSPLQLVSHDSTKRRDPSHQILVVQARARWSRARFDLGSDALTAELLGAAAALLGSPDVARPVATHLQRWRFSRLAGTPGFGRPLWIPVGSGRLGLAGEAFWPGGGVQAAFVSGRELARSVAAR